MPQNPKTPWVRFVCWRCSLYVQEDNNTSDIVDWSVLFLPSLDWFFNDGFSSFLGWVVSKVGHDYVCCLFVADEFPYTIWCEDYKMVPFQQVHLQYLGRCDDSNLSCCLIPKWSCHCEPWNIFLQMPYAQWTKWISMDVSIRLDSSTVS